MKVTMTFDNGPDPEVTPRVLKTLAAHGTKATFFVLGKHLAQPARRELAVRAFREGHQLGNHTFYHDVPFGRLVKPEDAVNEIIMTDTLLGELVGAERLFRPFGGGAVGSHLLNRLAWDFLVARGFTCVLWNCVAPEEPMPDTWMTPTLNACERQPWSVVVLHDIPTGATQHLDRFLGMLIDHGAEFSQDFPPECTPLRRGVSVGAFEHLIASNHAAQEPPSRGVS
jgi:peptidoglycan-N-acetylglucosamine deacetylase